MRTPTTTCQRADSVGSKVLARRAALGLTLGDVARRAGMETSYLEYVESRHGRPSLGVVRRLAEALHTTPEHLYGETVLDPAVRFARQDGTGAPAPKHVVSRLAKAECLLLLGSVPIGRVAFVVNGPPLVLPVNFTLMGHEIVIQTASMSPLAEMARSRRLVAFEADDVDAACRLGWSVLCQGPTRLSVQDDQHAPLRDELVRPWIGGDRRTVVIITPTQTTGRRIGLE